MKKYILKIGVAASLVAGGVSIASAAPINGTLSVSGRLQAATCTVSVTPAVAVPALTFSQISGTGANTPIVTVNGPKFTLTDCTEAGKRVYVTLTNNSGTDVLGSNIGLFTFNGDKDSPRKGPIYFKYFASEASTTPLDLSGSGQQAVNGDSKPAIKIYKYNTNNSVPADFAGSYDTTISMNYQYR
ncbi:type 1 fimbrial protein [Salmonella enterica subsp. enterica serovar Typhimurium]|nr:type 1 fimbrial protein [Salmonella enterica]EBM9901477.1 type 1 fimbrial protein [Salmonella enterica subsp. enterica serovar Typhimurium]EDB6035032.1 type 1 fimbrial protein [Salmonella enterica subsp. enterica serovar Enteritidis]EKR1802811.1 type 1 fimbrial protein [Salmonella enterica subsp. enterica serovar Dublin]EBQ4663211.1 type 1 fimbrial protein [Salmonella enterica]